jgi:hypothetical protein
MLKPHVKVYIEDDKVHFSQIAIVIEQPEIIQKDPKQKFFWQLRTHKGKVITEGFTEEKRYAFDSARRRFKKEYEDYLKAEMH